MKVINNSGAQLPPAQVSVTDPLCPDPDQRRAAPLPFRCLVIARPTEWPPRPCGVGADRAAGAVHPPRTVAGVAMIDVREMPTVQPDAMA